MRNADGTFGKGDDPDRNTTGSRGPNKELLSALAEAKKKHGNVSLIQNVCDRAYEDTPLAIAILRKILPDMKQVEVTRKYEGGYAEMTPAEAAAQMDKATVGEKPPNPAEEI